MPTGPCSHTLPPHAALLPSCLQLRYVLLPGKTDQPEDVEALIQFCKGKKNMQAIEVLPYHLLGVEVSRTHTHIHIERESWHL